jgi:hypothetical protein
MVYTQSDLDALDRAIAGSELEVQYGEKRVRFRSVDELRTARAHVAGQLAIASGGKLRSPFIRVRSLGKGVR